MSGAIFLLQNDDSLSELREAPYDSEDLLQSLIANYPNLLAGELFNRESPRRWLLVKREAGVPGKADGGNQWSIDNLFLDQDGIPTIVEVKRSSDTRIRREVVGQMLDYAANAVVYWPVSGIRTMFEERCQVLGIDPEVTVEEFLRASGNGSVLTADAFWEAVDQNLKSKRIRMLFVADVIPPELQRIVEFLNEQMAPAEVLALEIRQYVGTTAKTLVPRIIGQTSQAQATKSSGAPAVLWERDRFLTVLAGRTDARTAEVAGQLIDYLRDAGWTIMWGRGSIDGSCQPVFRYRNGNVWPFFLWTHGRLQIQFGHLATTAPFTDRGMRQEIRDRLLRIPDINLADDLDKYPSFFLSVLRQPGAIETLLETWTWIGDQLKEYQEKVSTEAAMTSNSLLPT